MFTTPLMRWGSLALLLMMAAHALAGCGQATAAAPPGNLRDPDSRLTAPPTRLAPVAASVKADPAMWAAYGQCRVAHADEADRRSGLVAHWRAIKGALPATTPAQ